MKTIFFEVQPWEQPALETAFPDVQIVSDPLSDKNVESYADAEIVSCFVYSSLPKEVLAKLPNLKYIATRSTGFDHVDTTYAKEHNIAVSNVPEYGSRTVAEYAFTLLLALAKKLHPSIHQMQDCNFNHNALQGMDLFGKTIGIIGLGKIGTETVKIAKGFGMNVLVNARTQNPEQAQELGFTYADMPKILAQSDVISLHLPDTKETHHIMNAEAFAQMKKGSYLINTARGGLIHTEALLQALENGTLAGAAIDVVEEEKNLSEEVEILSSHSTHPADFKTICMNHVLTRHPKVIVTPHNAFNTKEALGRITQTTIENIQAFLNGSVQNAV